MSDPVVTDIERIEAPFRRQLVLQDVAHESGLKMLRIRIREGTRFTILDVDAPVARQWGELMLAWAQTNEQTNPQATIIPKDVP
ncbi:MAG: hypothetical protein ABL901_07550 [Hyphomicrobiaceae bacterium]